MRLSLATVTWLLVWLALVAVVVAAMLQVRKSALGVYGTAVAQDEWDAWRADAKRLAADGPVKRREPKSPEPPALVLMRDYFGVSLALAIVLSSVLFATLLFFVRGAMQTAAPARPKPRQTL